MFVRLPVAVCLAWTCRERNCPGSNPTTLKALFAFGIDNLLVKVNPTLGVKKIPYVEKGHHAWTSDEIRQFEERHPIGTTPHLAMALLFHTGCRREDVVRFGPRNLQDGIFRYTQAKNEHRKPVTVTIAAPDEMLDAIAAMPPCQDVYLTSAYGEPYSVAGFGIRFRQWCDAAGLPHCSAHGLRKAATNELAESGATSLEIGSVSGHRSLKEIERYTAAVNQTRLAQSAMRKRKALRETVKAPSLVPEPEDF